MGEPWTWADTGMVGLYFLVSFAAVDLWLLLTGKKTITEYVRHYVAIYKIPLVAAIGWAIGFISGHLLWCQCG